MRSRSRPDAHSNDAGGQRADPQTTVSSYRWHLVTYDFDQREAMLMRKPEWIVIHHPASDNLKLDLKDHIHPPFTDAPYDWYINYDGRIEKGRSLAKRGAHVIPDYEEWKKVNNDTAIGVAFEGDFENDLPPLNPSAVQIENGAALIGQLCAEYNIHPMCVLPHLKVSRTACPGKHFMAQWQTFIGKVIYYRNRAVEA